MTTDLGLLILRLVAGLLLAGHGIQKVSFRLGGAGLAGGAREFRRDGFRGGALTALAAGATQIGAGLLLAGGALTPLAAAGATGVMTVALTVKWRHGLWVQADGYEYPLVLIAVFATLALTGPGRWSADEALRLLPWPAWQAALAVAAGLGSGLAVRLLLRRPSPAADPDHP
ncbi:DoxX family protein [Nonomuraea candida]|uniref:DoxX family protein n=1 Tax=Nonomuraea candida TaxID=359159 RepID=UPI0005BB5007|nr:DoxX family protein [Nonomuraea candida]